MLDSAAFEKARDVVDVNAVNIERTLLAAIVAVVLCACGQKGPLTLPTPPIPPAAARTADLPAPEPQTPAKRPGP